MPPPVYSTFLGGHAGATTSSGPFDLEPVPAGMTGVIRWVTITNYTGVTSYANLQVRFGGGIQVVLALWVLNPWQGPGAFVNEEFRVVLPQNSIIQGQVTGGPCDFSVSGYLLQGLSPFD